jgi:preprotein translocase subunit SecD
VVLVYKADAPGQAISTARLRADVDIMRARTAQLGVPSEIRLTGSNEITVALPAAAATNATGAQEQVGKTAQLLFYDWEPNVIGAEGKPAPTETTATGGPNAGAAQFGLLQYQAVLRAAKRPAILRPNDTTWQPGCTPEQANGCIYGSWYLLDTKHEKVLCKGNTKTCQPAETRANLYAEGYKPPPGAEAKAVRVNPGTVLVQARPEENKNGKVTNPAPNSFYVLNDDPVLTGSDITHPQQSFDEGTGTGSPNVTFGFTPHGQSIFQKVTKTIAQRGQEAQLPGVGREAAQQHFAVALDSQLITTPSIDYTKYPEGIDAANGSQISGGFTIASAQNFADELRSGALPVKLVLISQRRM